MLQRAMSELGHIDHDGPSISARAAAYLLAAGIRPPEQHIACPPLGGAFMAWLAIQDGLTPPVTASDAESWMSWGERLARPMPGCILVLTGDDGTFRHHVGVMLREAPHRYYVIEANRNVVQVRDDATSRVISARRPPMVSTSPMPVMSATEPTTVNLNLTVSGQQTSSTLETVDPPRSFDAVAVQRPKATSDDVEELKRRAVLAIAAAAESHRLDVANPDRWLNELAALAAEITTSTTIESVSMSLERAKAYMTRGAE